MATPGAAARCADGDAMQRGHPDRCTGGAVMTRMLSRFVAAPQRSEAWLALRKQGIGGSDVPAILGISPYKSRLQLWLEKRGDIDPVPVGAAAERGVILEDAVATMYMRATGRRLKQSHGMMVRRDAPYKYASLDRLVVGESRIVEIKTSVSPAWSLAPVPADVVAQVRWQMIVTGIRTADVAALLGGLVFRIETVEADDAVHAEIEAEVEAFWESVQTGQQPAPTHLDYRIMDQVHRAADETIYATETDTALLRRYLEARAAEAEAERQRHEAEALIKDTMRTATRLDAGSVVATWRETAARSSVDWEAIARTTATPKDLDILLERFKRHAAPQRRFVVKEVAHE